ncbi:hypothetical protein NADFUDRAFT_47812 [Nadsonia fulvescens var. elongata DSM 6958]|uniref:Uncharacterized protein n=1 Tax=Nadsonia fulvescens var. elongata DSM 6958 TaxID=857566 RepID=A0A1E3PGU2_9ASCO|nr:hypothetical protein NADFUDRAFT_47812 [Nadsonia fulvescens var. elongata DSM 6958]
MDYLRQYKTYFKYIKIGQDPDLTEEQQEQAVKVKLIAYLALALLMSGVVLHSLSSFTETCENKINCSWSVISILFFTTGAIISWGCFLAAWCERSRLLLG